MAKPRVTVDFSDIRDILRKIGDPEVLSEVGQSIVTDAKAQILKGQSPVAGHGPFQKYKDPKKYPGGKKPSRPVNLKLTGEMLNDFTFRRVAAHKILIGFDNRRKTAKIAGYHNEGTDVMAQRKFIPGPGESFTKQIMSAAIGILQKRLDLLIRQGKKKG